MSASDENLRDTIVREATRLFALRGFAGTSIRDLVTACECTKPAVYYYFDGKSGLFSDVLALHIRGIDELITDITRPEGDVRARLHDGVEKMIAHCQAEPMAMRLLQRVEAAAEEGAPEVNVWKMRATHWEQTRDLLEYGVSAKQLRDDLRCDDAATLLVGVLHLQFEQSNACGEWDAQRLHRTVDLVFEGIGHSK